MILPRLFVSLHLCACTAYAGLLQDRHGSTYVEKTANPNFPTTKYSYLAKSPCRPETDGFFGTIASKKSTHVSIEYVYDLESTRGADNNRINELIKEQIIDAVLSSTFPSVCGDEATIMHRRKLNMFNVHSRNDDVDTSAKITGFHFGGIARNTGQLCTPKVDDHNSCNTYKSTITVYGQNFEDGQILLNVLDYILEAVDNSITVASSTASQLGAIRVAASRKQSRLVPKSTDDSSIDDEPGNKNSLIDEFLEVSPITLVALAGAVFALAIGICVLMILYKIDKKYSIRESESDSMFYPGKHTSSRNSRCNISWLCQGCYTKTSSSRYNHNDAGSNDDSYFRERRALYNDNNKRADKNKSIYLQDEETSSETFEVDPYVLEFLTTSSRGGRDHYHGQKRVKFSLGDTLDM